MKEWENVPKDLNKYIGFVYLITNLTNGKKYIGSKVFWNKSRKNLSRKPTQLERERLERLYDKYKSFDLRKYKGLEFEVQQAKKITAYSKYEDYKKELKLKYHGRKKVVRGRVESNWRKYFGSSPSLCSDLELLGADSFRREILCCYESKFEVSYFEAKEQFDRGVLFRDDYYNEIVNVRLHKNIISNSK